MKLIHIRKNDISKELEEKIKALGYTEIKQVYSHEIRTANDVILLAKDHKANAIALREIRPWILAELIYINESHKLDPYYGLPNTDSPLSFTLFIIHKNFLYRIIN